MTFTQLVWKMAMVNKRKYIFYFLCNSFTVTVFFMFSTVFFNEKMIDHPQIQHGMNEIIMVPATALLIFTVFFISYAHSIFIRRRKKEFGLFMTLGMSNRDLTKLIILENAWIALASIVTGLLIGAVFSRLFFLTLMSYVGITKIPFYLNGKMFLYTIGLFLIVFIVAIGKTLFITKTNELVKILKWDRISDNNILHNPVLGLLGLIITLLSMVILYLFTYEKKFNLDKTIFNHMYEIEEGTYFILCTIGLFLGLYLTLSYFGSFVIQYTKRYPSIYYQRLLILKNINFKFKQLKSTFMLIIIMAMVTIFYSTITLYFYSSAERIAEELPYDIAFVQTETKNNISLDELYETLHTNKHSINDHDLVETFDYFKPYAEWDIMFRYTFMSVENFNKLSTKQLRISEGHYIYLNSSPTAEANEDYTDGLKFSNGENEISLILQDIVREPILDYRIRFYDEEFILLNETDYEILKSMLDVHIAELHLLHMSNWKQTVDSVNELKKILQAKNQITPKMDESIYTHLSFYSEDEFLKLVSKIDEYNMNRIDGGIMFFISTFLSILFFFATFILIFLNLFTDIEQERVKYRKLYKIGITKNEVSRMVSQELRIVFFLAPTIGIIFSYIYIITIAQDGGGIMSTPILIVNFLTIGGLYLFLQTIYYYFARKKFLNEIIS